MTEFLPGIGDFEEETREVFADIPDSAPLALRSAPRSLEEFAGQEHLVGPGKPLRAALEQDQVRSAIFFGPPGTGKTAFAHLVAARTQARVVRQNAVLSGTAEIKKILSDATKLLKSRKKPTLLILDEIHHFNRTQQDILLPSVERGEILLIGLTTENPSFYINNALLSRFGCYEFHPLGEEHLNQVLNRALAHVRIEIEAEARDHLVRSAGGDARRLLNALELAASASGAPLRGTDVLGDAALSPPPAGRITLRDAEEASQRRALRYDKSGDEHYDHASALIKSMRGSDPDAAVYWLAKMLEAGEDPRFLARRILIAASEDVGNADPQALVVASAAFQAVERIGLPEARIPLAQAAVYVACAPKSNACYLAIEEALEEVRRGPKREVPLHLRDANLDSASRGHGKGYKYPHDYPGHWAPQEYLPTPKTFYRPTDQGAEAETARRLKQFKK